MCSRNSRPWSVSVRVTRALAAHDCLDIARMSSPADSGPSDPICDSTAKGCPAEIVKLGSVMLHELTAVRGRRNSRAPETRLEARLLSWGAQAMVWPMIQMRFYECLENT